MADCQFRPTMPMFRNSLTQPSGLFYKYFLHRLNCSSTTQDLANIPPTLHKHSHQPLVCKCSCQLNVWKGADTNSISMTWSISIDVPYCLLDGGNVSLLLGLSIWEVSSCHTNVQDHFQRFLSTREGGGVNWIMAKPVLFAELCSVLQLWQKGNEWRERQTEASLC